MTDVATIIARLVDEIPPGRSKISGHRPDDRHDVGTSTGS